ncbi:FtsX-like permease family protein [Maribellus comscasis]|uniref:FtsX-like permease family protein n=1 Tax=Maribellus comscasis TaxID=2681766 RepID=A0A6I6JWV3_9BACT|nr:ABC transporter permease [Maribellus comscasis]QGY44617.1 FtsX-like permease family protein [Maribellus comscasis]
MILKVVIRNLLKHPFLNLVKVIGLSLALTGIVFIALFLKNELSYDSYHSKSERIYRYTITEPDFLGGKHFARTINPGYIPQLKEAIPELENFTRLMPVRGGLIKYDERFYNINEAFECDSTFFQVFDARLLIGDKQKVLENPASMVVTESFAKKVFGDTNPVGKILTLPAGQFYGETQDFTVQGMMKDFPSNSHFHPDFITTPGADQFANSWAWTYLLLAENANPENVKSGISAYLKNNRETNPEEMNTQVYLQKLGDIHLKSHKLREIEPAGSLTNIYVLTIAALILLLISISNYANLNMGMAGFSAKYMFVNKLLGSSKYSIVSYFFIEGLFIVAATSVLALMIAFPINSLIAKMYGLNLLNGNTFSVAVIVLLFNLSALIPGMTPVLNFDSSSFRIRTKRNASPKMAKGRVSSALIIFQYGFSIALIVSVIVISKQTKYALNSSIGVNEDNIVCFESVHSSIQQKFKVLKEELLKYNSIESVSAMMEPPGGEANDMFPFEMEGYKTDEQNQEYDRIGVFPCDYSFTSIFNLRFLSGENFSKKNTDADGSGEYIINEAAMHRLGYSEPDKITGKEFKLIFSAPGSGIEIPGGKIIGVVKDFHLQSLKNAVEPLVFFKRENLWLINLVISYKPEMQAQALNDMKTVWNSLFPEYPFQYKHVGAMYKKVYKAELLQARLLSVFTIIALFISSMGLFGMALISTQRRVKEIGVRKVNGARVSEIVTMLNRDYLMWVGAAFIIASPVAWYTMNRWLENFAYKTGLNWWIFLVAGLLALGIALLTVSFQSWKAATRNPVEALRYE